MKTVKKKRLSEMVADEIKQYIKKENLTSGDRLPAATELMSALGIGRSTLREALQLLESQDILEVLNGKGTFIKDAKPFYIRTAFDVENEKNFLLDALDVRIALEGKAVDLAVHKATEKDIAIMQQHLTDYVRYINESKREQANRADARFHQALYEAADNQLLTSIIDSVWDTFHQFWNEPFGQDDIFDQSYPFHVSLLEAIQQRDTVAAADSFQKMMESVKSSIEKYQE
ncbi:FadR/GntR family transcriptional regulator [Sediminibacillus halophilus]|uniref:DNA-binding transcriptional regulator, FadR family n=1 Tax=Sediminibacillus halophilus TaxID=482461 RepID=A0A1G9N765_9BACI|nr:FadR/GntR family transcriptional regulator [Sediminibacillus halophilus]SDL82318.1 DNA-binding transcriptional regulator, FadR family [Sediminibacillus halophilus]